VYETDYFHNQLSIEYGIDLSMLCCSAEEL